MDGLKTLGQQQGFFCPWRQSQRRQVIELGFGERFGPAQKQGPRGLESKILSIRHMAGVSWDAPPYTTLLPVLSRDSTRGYYNP